MRKSIRRTTYTHRVHIRLDIDASTLSISQKPEGTGEPVSMVPWNSMRGCVGAVEKRDLCMDVRSTYAVCRTSSDRASLALESAPKDPSDSTSPSMAKGTLELHWDLQTAHSAKAVRYSSQNERSTERLKGSHRSCDLEQVFLPNNELVPRS